MASKPPSTPAPQQIIPLVDDPDAPVIFADELTGGGPNQGNFNLTFAVVQYDHGQNPPKAYRRVCLRLVMPAGALQAAGQFVGSLLTPTKKEEEIAVAKPTLQ